jgi:hypothetical protein
VEAWGVGLLKGYFIQYKFIIPESVKHSSYTYQKLFRALYGYTQVVNKSNGRSYKYHRRGVLSDVPYIRPGKNCVIIPPEIFQKLIEFFKTGKNPTHRWKGKGDWKAVYYMDEKEVGFEKIVSAFEELLDRAYVLTTSQEHERLAAEVEAMLDKGKENVDPSYKSVLLAECQKIIDFEWFKEAVKKSEKLSKFYESARQLKAL